MSVNELLTLTNFIINKETTGDALIPGNYNVLLQEVNISLFNEYWDQYRQMMLSQGMNDLLLNSPLNVFIEIGSINVNQSTGQATMPSDFIHAFTATVDQTGKKIDLITPAEAYYRNSAVMTVPAQHRHYGYIAGNKLQVFPYIVVTGDPSSLLAAVTMSYLRLPVRPVYDYCQNATTYKRIFMPASSYLVYDSVTPKWDLYSDTGSVSVLLSSNVTKDGALTSSPAYTSLTTELEWRENMHPLFVSRILGKVGINLSEQGVTQYAELMKKEGQ